MKETESLTLLKTKIKQCTNMNFLCQYVKYLTNIYKIFIKLIFITLFEINILHDLPYVTGKHIVFLCSLLLFQQRHGEF